MANEKWLSNVAKSGDYNDLANKIEVVTDINSTSEMDAASARSVKIVYDKALDSINISKTSKEKISKSLNDMGVTTDGSETFEQLSEKIKTIKSGIDTDNANATADKILVGNSAYVKGQKVEGSMKNHPSSSSGLAIQSSNGTVKCQIEKGAYLESNESGNPEITYKETDVSAAIGLTPDKILSGTTIGGITGSMSIVDSARVVNVVKQRVPTEASAKATDYRKFTVNVGFRPRYIFLKFLHSEYNWSTFYYFCTKDGINEGIYLYENHSTTSHYSPDDYITITDTGFVCDKVTVYDSIMSYTCAE